MLYRSAVSDSTFELLKGLQAMPEFANLRLVGGTALALQIGHRISVDLDFVNYQYPWLEELLIVDTIKMAGIRDIAAMKIAAITGRGSKKDFIDIYFLLKHFTFEEILNSYKQKYTDASIYMALKSLAYFDDADREPSLNMLIETNWENVKKRIREELTRYVSSY